MDGSARLDAWAGRDRTSVGLREAYVFACGVVLLGERPEIWCAGPNGIEYMEVDQQRLPVRLAALRKLEETVARASGPDRGWLATDPAVADRLTLLSGVVLQDEALGHSGWWAELPRSEWPRDAARALGLPPLGPETVISEVDGVTLIEVGRRSLAVRAGTALLSVRTSWSASAPPLLLIEAQLHALVVVLEVLAVLERHGDTGLDGHLMQVEQALRASSPRKAGGLLADLGELLHPGCGRLVDQQSGPAARAEAVRHALGYRLHRGGERRTSRTLAPRFAPAGWVVPATPSRSARWPCSVGVLTGPWTIAVGEVMLSAAEAKTFAARLDGAAGLRADGRAGTDRNEHRAVVAHLRDVMAYGPANLLPVTRSLRESAEAMRAIVRGTVAGARSVREAREWARALSAAELQAIVEHEALDGAAAAAWLCQRAATCARRIRKSLDRTTWLPRREAAGRALAGLAATERPRRRWAIEAALMQHANERLLESCLAHGGDRDDADQARTLLDALVVQPGLEIHASSRSKRGTRVWTVACELATMQLRRAGDGMVIGSVTRPGRATRALPAGLASALLAEVLELA